MKNFLAVPFVLIVIASGCESRMQVTHFGNQTGPLIAVPNRTILIDGCEYIESDTAILNKDRGPSRVYSLTHKGNCKNPAHGLVTKETETK